MYLFQDWLPNNSLKGKLLCVFFRIASLGSKNILLKIIFLPYLLFYKFMIEWVLGVEIPYNTKIGPGAKIFGNISIADNCAIAANAAVGKSFFEPNIMIGGVPAQVIKTIDIKRIIPNA